VNQYGGVEQELSRLGERRQCGSRFDRGLEHGLGFKSRLSGGRGGRSLKGT
jgi:hypothetical protein